MSDFVLATSHFAQFIAAFGGGIVLAALVTCGINRFTPRTHAIVVNVGLMLIFVPLGLATLGKYEDTYGTTFRFACALAGCITAFAFTTNQAPLAAVRDQKTRRLVLTTTSALAVAYAMYLGACVYLDIGPRPEIAAFYTSTKACDGYSLDNSGLYVDSCALHAAADRWYRHASVFDRAVYLIREDVGLSRATYEGGLAQI